MVGDLYYAFAHSLNIQDVLVFSNDIEHIKIKAWTRINVTRKLEFQRFQMPKKCSKSQVPDTDMNCLLDGRKKSQEKKSRKKVTGSKVTGKKSQK